MPARSTRIYVVNHEAGRMGLSFATPPWWDVERLFERNVYWQIALPDGRVVLLLSWPCLLDFDPESGRKTWNVPGRKSEDRARRARRETLPDAARRAEWFIVERDRVWAVPERSSPGCDVFEEPPWWHFASIYPDPDFKRWYQTFRDVLWKRRRELANPSWVDYVSLLTGEEALFLDERTRSLYRTWKKETGQRGGSAYVRREMTRFAHALQQARWVLLYDYEWESGLE